MSVVHSLKLFTVLTGFPDITFGHSKGESHEIITKYLFKVDVRAAWWDAGAAAGLCATLPARLVAARVSPATCHSSPAALCPPHWPPACPPTTTSPLRKGSPTNDLDKCKIMRGGWLGRGMGG
jgi:hypothetical protein